MLQCPLRHKHPETKASPRHEEEWENITWCNSSYFISLHQYQILLQIKIFQKCYNTCHADWFLIIRLEARL